MDERLEVVGEVADVRFPDRFARRQIGLWARAQTPSGGRRQRMATCWQHQRTRVGNVYDRAGSYGKRTIASWRREPGRA